MGILDTILGRNEPQQTTPGPPPVQSPRTATTSGTTSTSDPDAQAVARYRYMLQTAPPETLEQAHTEAFARLTPEQRRLALQQLANVVPENERASLQDDPQSLARAATRAEVRQPGILDRTFGGMGGGGMMGGGMMGGGIGMGGMLAGGLLTSIAGSFIGSSIAHSFFSQPDVINNFYGANPEFAGTDGYNGGENNAAMADNNPYNNDGDGGTSVDPNGDGYAGGIGDLGDSFGGGDAGGDFGGGDF